MDYETIMLEADEMMEKSVDHVRQEFASLHTGKATPAMVEGIPVQVEAYGGASMHIREMAAVTTPDPRTIQIQPYDKSTVKDISRGIQKANIGLNPVADGAIIRIPVPELSGDRRREMVRMTHQMAEDGRVGVRAGRRHAMDGLKKLQKDGDISEDDLKRFEKDVQESTDTHTAEIARLLEAKEKELTTV